MPSYISSNENRIYVCRESKFGEPAALTAANRIPAVQVRASRKVETAERKDKTGSRTYFGLPQAVRCRSQYQLSTYMTNWPEGAGAPGYSPLVESALGGMVEGWSPVAISQASGNALSFASAHGLRPGQAVARGGEIRFVTGVADSRSVVLNAPFAVTAEPLSRTASYRPATHLPSFTLFDYWAPGAVNRVLAGSGIDELRLKVNGDFHGFEFSGDAAELIDSASFEAGQAGLAQFPPEPEHLAFDHTIVPGHLGQVWLGSAPDQFFTLTAGEVIVSNELDMRAREFGSATPRGISAGMRKVTVDFTVFAQDDAATKSLHQASRQRSPIPVMFQLGEQAGQLCGVFLPSVVLEAAEFDDRESRLQWSFRNGRAQGSGDDELFIAFA